MRPFFSVKLLKLALPIMLSQAGQMVMGMVDAWVIGRTDTAALGGVGLGNSIISSLMFASLGLTLVLDTKIPQAWGAKKYQRAMLFLSQGLWLAIWLGIPIGLLGLGTAYFLPHFGVQASIATSAQPFVAIVSLSIPLFLLFTILQRYWMARGVGAPGMVILVAANFVNLALNLWLVPHYQTVGTGISTLVSRVFMVLCFVVYTLYREPRFRLRFDRFRVKIQKKLVIEGLPITGQLMLEIGVFTIATFMAARIGITEGASHHVVLMLASFTFMFPLGIGSATNMLVGNALGAKDYAECRHAGWDGWRASVVIMTLSGVLLGIFGDVIVGWFTNDPLVIELSRRVLVIAALFQIFDGIQVTATGALRGIEQTKQSMWANLIGHYPIGLVVGSMLCFSFGQGLIGLWIGLASGLLVVASILTWVWHQKSMEIYTH